MFQLLIIHLLMIILGHIQTHVLSKQMMGVHLVLYHFQQQLQIINPNLVVALGEDVGNKMLNVNKSIEMLNGRIHKLKDFNLIVTYHPEAILKNPKLKQSTWEDFKKIRDNYLN